MARTWATSDTIQVFALSTGKTRFIEAGHRVEPILSGEFKNYVIIQTDVIPKGGGHVTDFWLFDRTGKRIKRIGTEAELSKFKEVTAANR